MDITGLVGEFKKLYPEIPEDKIKRIAERSCSRLRHIGKRLKNKLGKCSSSKSSKECERSRSRRCKKSNVEKPANFEELVKTLKNDFPNVEEKRLIKILERH